MRTALRPKRTSPRARVATAAELEDEARRWKRATARPPIDGNAAIDGTEKIEIRGRSSGR